MMLNVATMGRYVTLPVGLGGVRTCFGEKLMMKWVLMNKQRLSRGDGVGGQCSSKLGRGESR